MRWPLVGRTGEEKAIDDALDNGGGVVITGPAGVGKSRLLASLVDRRRADGVEVIEIAGVEAVASMPMAPLLSLIEPGADGHLAAVIVRELARRARRRPVLVTVDDAHLLDKASAAAIHQLARSRVATLAVSVRMGEPAPAAIEALSKDELLARFDIEPLDRPSFDELVAAVLGPVTAPTGRWLWDHCRGHPLYLRELLDGLIHDGTLRPTSQGYAVDRSVRVPPRLVDLVEHNLDRLGPRSVRALAAVALSQPIAEVRLRQVVAPAEFDRLRISELIELGTGQVTLGHPLHGEAAVRRLTDDEIDRLRTDLAQALGATEENSAQAAVLLLDAGQEPPPELLRRALDQAIQRRQPNLAVRIGEALTADDRDPQVLAGMAGGRAMLGDLEEADRLFRLALSRCRPDQTAPMWLTWIRDIFEYGDPSAAQANAERAREALGGLDRLRATALWVRARMFVEPLGPVRDDLVALADDPALPAEAATTVFLDIATVCWHLLDLDLGLAMAERALVATGDDPTNHARSRQVTVALQLWRSGIHEAERLAVEFLGWAERSRDPDMVIHAWNALTLVAARQGNATTTMERLGDHHRAAEATVDQRHVALMVGEKALALSALPDHEWKVRELLALIETFPDGGRVNAEPLAAVARSRLARRAGDPSGAARHLAHGVERAAWRQSRAHELVARRDRVIWDGPTEADVARMAEIAAAAGAGLAELHADEAQALLDEDPAALEGVSDRALAFGADLVAWESAASAHRLYRSGDDLVGALRMETRVDGLSDRFRGQDSPAWTMIEPVLTERERAVAEQVATGATNAEAAAALYLSPSTVKRHLERIYGRLGLTSREELAAALGQEPPTVS